MRWISMFDLLGNKLFDGFINFCDQLPYQLNSISLGPSSSGQAIPSIYAWSKLTSFLCFKQTVASLSYEQNDREEEGDLHQQNSISPPEWTPSRTASVVQL